MSADVFEKGVNGKWPTALVAAVKALAAGSPRKDQCEAVINWLINDVAKTNDLSFRLDSERATAFAEGKRFVGLELRRVISQSFENLTGVKPTGEHDG